QALPYEACMGLAAKVAWLAYHLDRRHRLVADDNLRHAFPERDARARDELVRATYRHFVGLAVTLVFLPRLFRATTWKRYLDFSDPKMLLSVMLSGRPLLFVTGHFGNWELGNVALGVLGFRTAAIARRLDNPHLHRFLLALRARHGQALLDKKEDYDRMLAV